MATLQQRNPAAVFARADIFAGLSEADLADFAAHFSLRTFSRGENLMNEGDQARVYYLVAEGQVKIIQTSAEGFEVILHIMGPDDFIGALPTLGEGAYPASGVALSEVVAYGISSDVFQDEMCHHPRVCLNLLRFAARQLQAAQAVCASWPPSASSSASRER
jgi:CRP-like cAMP-binding protein